MLVVGSLREGSSRGEGTRDPSGTLVSLKEYWGELGITTSYTPLEKPSPKKT